MNILSLFDGMACGMLAFQKAGVQVDTYTAYEIDKYAIQTATHNFPNIKECGNVFEADFTRYKDIDYIVGGSPCFTEGHLVLTDKGYKDISKVEVGDCVLTHKNRFMPVTRTYKKESPTVNLKITGYPNFVTTDNHPFYCETKSKLPYSEYMMLHTWRLFSEPEWVKVQDMNENTFCGIHATINKVSDCNIDDETLWLLGRYVADGHIRKSKRKERQDSYQYQFIISVGDHKLEQFKSICKSRHYSCYPHGQSVHRCVFSSKELVDFVIDNNFGTSALTKRIPEFVMNLPDEKAEIFLNGYLSGDGHYIEKDNSYNATTISKELAFDLQRLATRLYKTNVSVSLQSNDRKSRINGRVIKGNYPIYFIKFKKEIRKQSVAHYDNDIVWTAFKSKEPTGNVETVYNIEVEEDHSYTVNNCIVHNCTYWSIVQKNNRETEASGLGWELFSQYVRALREVKPKFFIYENNKSMSAAIRQSISETFGFEPICINSALVSAQNRQRLYWVGKRNDDGTYSKVDVQQPEDKGILLKDILDTGIAWQDKSFAYTTRCQAATTADTLTKHRHTMVAEPVCVAERGRYGSDGIEQHYEVREDGKTNVLTTVQKDNNVAEPVNVTDNGKSQTIKAQYQQTSIANICCYSSTYGATGVAEPVACRCRGRKDKNGNGYAKYECRDDLKANTLDTNSTNGSMVAEPVTTPACMRYERSEEAKRVRKQYENGETHHGFHELSELHPRTDGKTNTLSTVLKDNPICEPVSEPIRVGALPRPNGELSTSQAMRVYSTEGKSVNLVAGGGGMGGKTGLYAIPVEFEDDKPTKAISCADGKTYTVYEVKDGQITIKGKQYPIKLADGYYIIRKLTVSECKRLQTVPEWYEFPVSDSQAYKCLGNGWTVEVIAHLIEATLKADVK